MDSDKPLEVVKIVRISVSVLAGLLIIIGMLTPLVNIELAEGYSLAESKSLIGTQSVVLSVLMIALVIATVAICLFSQSGFVFTSIITCMICCVGLLSGATTYLNNLPGSGYMPMSMFALGIGSQLIFIGIIVYFIGVLLCVPREGMTIKKLCISIVFDLVCVMLAIIIRFTGYGFVSALVQALITGLLLSLPGLILSSIDGVLTVALYIVSRFLRGSFSADTIWLSLMALLPFFAYAFVRPLSFGKHIRIGFGIASLIYWVCDIIINAIMATTIYGMPIRYLRIPAILGGALVGTALGMVVLSIPALTGRIKRNQ